MPKPQTATRVAAFAGFPVVGVTFVVTVVAAGFVGVTVLRLFLRSNEFNMVVILPAAPVFGVIVDGSMH